MSKPIEITPELLADIEAKAEFVEPKIYRLNESYDIICDNPHLSGDTILIAKVEFGEDAEFIAAANPAVVLAMAREIKLLRSRRGWRIQAMLRDIELSIAAVNGSNESKDFVEDHCKCDREVGICCQYCQIFHTLKRCKSQIESEVEI